MQKSLNTGRLILLALLTGGVFLQSCEPKDKKPEAEKGYVIPDTVMQTLRIDTVAISPLVNAITLTGKVGANEDNVVPVYSLVTGMVQDIKVVLGDYVQQGQILAVVRSQEMAQYGSDLLNAETNLHIAQKNLEKTIDMYHSGLASMTDSLSAEVAVHQATAELNRVNQVLKIHGGSTNGEYIVHAPLSRVPENAMKFTVGALRTTYGTFWSAEGAGASWPGDETATTCAKFLAAARSIDGPPTSIISTTSASVAPRRPATDVNG